MKLKIHNVGPKDFGSYRCVAKNSLGETDGLIKLDGNVFHTIIYIQHLQSIQSFKSHIIAVVFCRAEIPAPTTTTMSTESFGNRTNGKHPPPTTRPVKTNIHLIAEISNELYTL